MALSGVDFSSVLKQKWQVEGAISWLEQKPQVELGVLLWKALTLTVSKHALSKGVNILGEIGWWLVLCPTSVLQPILPQLLALCFRFSKYRITSKYSNALRTSQKCSFAKWYHILHPKVAFEAPGSWARCGIKSVHDVTLHLSLNQCWKTLLFEYLAAIRYILWLKPHTYTRRALWVSL